MKGKKVGRIFGIIAVGVLALMLLVIAGADVQETLMRSRWESSCEGGDAAVCGHLALVMLRDDESYESKAKGMEMMRKTCDQGFSSGCRMAATFGERRQPSFGGNTVQVLGDQRDQVVDKQCLEGKAQACFVAAYLALSTENVVRQKTILDASKKVCAVNADGHACRAASILGDGEAHLKACEAGYADSCVKWAGVKIDARPDETQDKIFSPEEVSLMKKVCDETQYRGICFLSADDALRKACWNGDFVYCGEVKYDSASEHADVFKAFYTGMSTLGSRDMIGYSYGRPPEDFSQECKNGMAEACYVEGVRLIASYHMDWSPKRASDDALKATFGEACVLGMNAGCLAYGVEMLNRPPKKRQIKRANAMLKIACDRGHAYSCWTQNFEKDLRADKTDAMKAAAHKACKASTTEENACDAYLAVLEYELGATPWVMSDRRAAAKNQPLCQSSEPKACRDRVWVSDFGRNPLSQEMPAMVFSTFADAERACKKQNIFSCTLMFYLAEEYWPVHEPKREADLRKRVCAKMPQACEQH